MALIMHCMTLSNDAQIYRNYRERDHKEGKAANKAELQKQLGLEVNPNKYMIGLISRS